MGRQLISVLLGLSIVACPLVCQAGSGSCCKENAPVVQSCCDACNRDGTQVPAEGGGVPVDDDSQSSPSRGGCICNGAVVEAGSVQILFACNDAWSPPSIAQLGAGCDSHSLLPAISRSPLPDHDMNPGRAMRCRMMSYLC